MKILQVTAHFYPNVGGIETHLTDLVKALTDRGHQVTVLTYRPLTTKAEWKIYEKQENLMILRLPWFPGFFYQLVSYPILEFIYLLPGLFIATPSIILWRNPEVIAGHGLVAGFVALFWGKIFGKRVILSTHSIYHFPKTGLYHDFVKFLFGSADFSMGLSKQAEEEIKSVGISPDKVGHFTYWIDLNKFKSKKSKLKIRQNLKWDNKFVVLFVGRLVEEKGILELLEAQRMWNKKITLVVIGNGPLESRIKNQESRVKNLTFLGKVDQDDLSVYYSAADLLIVPSIHEEGFGRVILESLACRTPVIGAKRGAIPEAMDSSVGRLIDVTPKNIKEAVEYFYNHPKALHNLAKNTRVFAEKRFSEKNVERIIHAYQG